MATRYWVGGAGNWSSTTKWSTSSGGASGASVPTSVDDVVFDANSGGKFTATVDTAQTVNSITITPSSGAGVLQISLSATLTTGNLTTTGTAGNNRIWFRETTYGIAINFVVNGTVSISDCDFRNIYVIGSAAPISGTRIGNLAGCSGITFSAPKTVYWNLAGAQNWSATGWSATSTGTPNDQYFPLAQDTATFTNAGSVTGTITFDGAVPYTGTVDMSGRTSAMTLFWNAVSSVYGDWKNGSGTTLTITGSTISFSGRNTQTITSAGKTFGNPLTVDSYGGTVQLADAFNVGTYTITVNNGTFNTQGYSVTAAALSSSNSNVRTINLGASTVTLSNPSFLILGGTNLTFNANTSTVTYTGTTAGTITSPGVTFYNVSFTGTTAVTHAINGINTFNNLTFTAPASAGLMQCTFSANQTINGTLTAAGSAPTQRIFLRSDTLGTTRTLTVNSLSATDCDFRDITIAGAAAGSSPTRAGDCGGNTGITFPAPKTVYWNLSGAQNWSATGWATSSGGSPAVNNFPLAQDTAVFDNTGSVTGTITTNLNWNAGSIDMSARTNAMTFGLGTSFTLYGNLTLGTGVTTANAPTLFFSGRGTNTLTSNGRSITWAITIDAVTGTLQLGDALNISSATQTLTLNSGTFDAVTYNVTTGVFTLTAGTLKMGSGTWTISGTGAVWTYTAGTFYKGTANIVLSDTSTTARTFSGGGLSYNKLTIGGTTGTSTLTFIGNNQFTELASTKTVAHTIALGTTAQTFGKWSVTGTSGNVVTLTGTGTITIAGARVSGVDYLALGTTVISATSPGEFYAGANSTGGTNAILTAAPSAVTRYWVGGTGTWDATTTTNWSATSGGAGGASVPTSADAVVFNTLSNATAYTVTCTATQLRCAALTMAGPVTGNVTWAGSAPLVIQGNVSLAASGITRTYTGAITLSSSSTGLTFTTNGVALASAITVNGVGCGWSLGSALDHGTAVSQPLTITNGSFNTANYNLTSGNIDSSNSNGRSITLGSSTVTITVLSGNPINFSSTETARAALTFSAGTSQINCNANTATFNGNNQTFYGVLFTGTSVATATINGANTFNNLSFAGRTSAGVANVIFSANQTINGTLTLSAGTDATMRTFVQSDTIGTTRTLTCATVASLTDIDFRDITIAGAAAPVSGTRLGDCKGNSGITFGAGVNKYWNLAAGGNWGGAIGWATTGGGTPAINNFPLAQDTAIFQSTGLNSAATVTVNASYNIGTIDMSARTSNTMTLVINSSTPAIYGNWINGTGSVLSGGGIVTFAGRTTQTITSAGQPFTQAFILNSPSGSISLQDAFVANASAAGILTVTSGTFNANTYNVTFSGAASTIIATGTGNRAIAFGSGTWTFAGSGTTFTAATSTNLTVTGTGTISLTSASAKTFAGGGISYSGITLNQGGAGALTITGNNTFANITNTYSATGAANINIGTTTQTVTQFTATGTAGNLLTVQGSSASSPGTLILTSGTVTTPNYLAITGVRAYSLSSTWYAGANSVNNGSLGWIFSASSLPSTGNFFMMF